MSPIAQRTMLAVDKKSGVQSEVVIEVFAPRHDGKDYFCLAHIRGIEGESYDHGGVDSLQALSLALGQIKKRFDILRKEQYDFLFPEGGHPIESFDYSDIDWGEKLEEKK